MFVAGAILASSIVMFVMRRGDGPAPAPAVESAVTAAPAEAAEEPTPAATPDPAPAVAPQPERPSAKPSAMPRRPEVRRDERRAEIRQSSSPSAVVPQPPAPVAVAQNTPPVAVPTAQADPAPVLLAPQPAVVEQRAPEPPPQPKTVTIPAGTLLTVRVDQTLRSDRSQNGDSFRATLDQPLVVDGFVIAERGSQVEGRVSEVDPGGRVRGVANMTLELVRLTTSDGQRVRLQTETFARQGQKDTKGDAAKIGVAAGIGAAIGAIAGGGKGAAIGAGVGGAAGAGGVMATRGKAAEIPAETRLSFRLREPITITEKL
jgi:hypothetical protein